MNTPNTLDARTVPTAEGITHVDPDQYLLCFSSDLSASLAMRFGDKTRLAVRINRPTALMDAIGEALNVRDPLLQYEISKVRYHGGRAVPSNHPPPACAPWFLKEADFSSEREIRAVWRTEQPHEKLTSGIVHIADIGRYVEPIEIPPGDATIVVEDGHSFSFTNPNPFLVEQFVKHKGSTYRNTYVNVDGQSFDGCTFVDVVFVYGGTRQFQMKHCNLHSCRWEWMANAALRQSPANTGALLRVGLNFHRRR